MLKPLTKTVADTERTRPVAGQVAPPLQALNTSVNFASTVALNEMFTVVVPPAVNANDAGVKVFVSPAAGAVTAEKVTVPANPLRLVRVPVARLVKEPFGILIVVGVTVQE